MNNDKSAVTKSRAYSTKYEDHIGLLHKLSRGGFARLMGANVNIDYEDVFQMNCVSYVLAARRYNPEVGITFSAYAGQSVLNNFSQSAKRLTKEKFNLGMVSIEDMHCGDEEYVDPFEFIADHDEATACERMESMQEAREKLSKLSKKARMVIRDLIKPPKEMVDHHRAEYAQSCHAKTIGVRAKRISSELDLAYIVKKRGMTLKAFEEELRKELGIVIR